jgi:hypothetical protein
MAGPWILLLAPSLLLGALGAAAGTTTLYRSVDANGVVQYSDTPSPGAQKITVSSPNSSSSVTPGYSSPAVRTGTPTAAESSRPRCEIAAPKPEQVFFDTQSVGVQVQIDPAPPPGARTVLNVDGTEVPGEGTSFSLNPVYRGAHTVAAVVYDAAGTVSCETSSLTFYVRDASLLQSTRGTGQSAPAAPGVPVAPGVPRN